MTIVNQLENELEAAYRNLTTVQELCTKQLNELRSATTFLLGWESDDEKRPCVLVARHFLDPHVVSSVQLHSWGVYVQTSSCVHVRGAPGVNAELANKSRQFDTQREALDYGKALLKELRDA